ncbi:MAG: MXAN_5187 C-terminal domain-containing protein, partial [Polyangiales bacterium]
RYSSRSPVEPNEITEQVEELELRLERLGALYNSFFQGIEKLPPNVVQKDVERRIWTLRREKIRNTGTRFKFNQITQRYNTMQSYWMRIMREIENGTYKRHVAKAKRRFGDDAFNPVKEMRRQKAEDAEVEVEVSLVNSGELEAYDAEDMDDIEIDAHSIRISQLDLDRVSLPPAAEERVAKPRSVPPPARVAPASPPPPVAPRGPERTLSDPTMRAQVPKFERPSNSKLRAMPARPPQPRPVFGAEDDLDSLLDTALGGGDAGAPPPARSAGAAQPSAPIGSQARMAAQGPPDSTPSGARPTSGTSQARAPAFPPPARAASNARMPAVVPDSSPSGLRPTPAPSQDRIAAQRPAPVPSQDRIAAQRPAPVPSNPRLPAIASRPAPAEGGDFRNVYERYVEAKRNNGESTASVTYDGLVKNLRETADKLRTKHGGKQIDFEVGTKDGKTILKPVVK